jgi:hypothetical protein
MAPRRDPQRPSGLDERRGSEQLCETSEIDGQLRAVCAALDVPTHSSSFEL